VTIPTDEVAIGTFPTWQQTVDFRSTNTAMRGTEYFYFPSLPRQPNGIEIYTPDVAFAGAGDLSGTGATVTYTMYFWANDGTTLLGQFAIEQTGPPAASGHWFTPMPDGTAAISHEAVNDMTGPTGPGGSRTWIVNWAYRVYGPVLVEPLPPPPPMLDLAATLTKLYLVLLDGTAQVWFNGTRVVLYLDSDSRNIAAGMVAVATAGEAAFFCDWKLQLWATGDVYVQNEVTGDWASQTLFGYLVKVPIKAETITLMGPHGIGPSYMNSAALWVNKDRNLIGLGQADNAELENGLLPSYPNPITQPTGGGYSWAAPVDGSAIVATQPSFDYRQYIWRALATSNYGAYAYFGAKIGGPIRPQGHMIG